MTFLGGLLPAAVVHIGWLAQLADPGIDTPEEAALIFSGPQFFIALLSGVVLAFGFQLLLTNLSVAAGVSYLSRTGSSSDDSSGTGVKTISVAFGLWTLVTVSLALFFACWLAVKLSLYNSALLGAITGLVVWGTYFTLLTWISSTTVGSLVGSVVKSATSGLQAVVGTATAALGAKSASNQLVQTAEATAAAVRRELTAGFDATTVREGLQEYLGGLSSSEVDVVAVEQEFERLLRNSDVAVVDTSASESIDSELFVKLLSDRTNLSRQEAQRVAKRLYRVWQRYSSGSSQLDSLLAFITSASAGQLATEGLGTRLDAMVQELKQRRQHQSSQNGVLSQALSQGLNGAIGMILGKIDLSDMDANKLVNQLKSAQHELASQASEQLPQLAGQAASQDSVVKADVESYLHHAYIGELKSAELEEIFRNVLYDAQADATELREQLSTLNRKIYVEALKTRGLLTQAEIKEISTRLEIVRLTVLKDVMAAEKVAVEKRIRHQLEIFFKFTPAAELSSEMGDRAFRAIFDGEPIEAEHLHDSIGRVSSDYFRQFLLSRDDLNPEVANELANRYYRLLERVLADTQSVQEAAKVRLAQQQQAVENYLRNTGKPELRPEGIKRDLRALMEEPDRGVRQVRSRMARFDRDTFVQLLGQRPEFTEQEVDSIIDTVEENWIAAMQAPEQLSAIAQAKYNEATAAIADYLRSTGKPELSPEGIRRDLQKLADNPKVGAKAIRYRLSKMDRDTLVQLLSQRGDLTEAEVNQTIDDVLSSIQSIIRSPRRFARRAQELPALVKSKALSFESALEDYLRNTEKAELHPEGIKRDLNLLLNDPKLGASRLGDRLSRMDDSTMVALLAQRPDMTEAEAARVVGQIAEVRRQAMAQIRSIQQTIESAIARIFARIRQYLNSLERPELNYYGIRKDVRTLFDDPQAGFEALRDRLAQFDRYTLIALLSSHDRISEADAHRVIDQVESARDSVLQQAEQMERKIESRLSSIKAQTHQQVEDTKRAAEAAAWWLFGTALISALVSALGGSLAVAG